MTKRIPLLPVAFLSLLLIPLIALQFSDQVDWSSSDFLIMGVLLLVVGFGIDFILRRVKETPMRVLYIALAILVFLLIWAELSVGIFGTPFAGS